MLIRSTSPDDYISKIPAERQEAFSRLREAIKNNIPEGFEETINYNMIGYVVPHSLFPAGYHTNPKEPLPFINIASQKNFIALYHMGLYANTTLLQWFTKEFAVQSKYKLDMGKGCVRFKKTETIPFNLIGELAGKISPAKWIEMYTNAFVKK